MDVGIFVWMIASILSPQQRQFWNLPTNGFVTCHGRLLGPWPVFVTCHSRLVPDLYLWSAMAGVSLTCICDVPWQVGPWPVFVTCHGRWVPDLYLRRAMAGGSLTCICDVPWQVGPWPVFVTYHGRWVPDLYLWRAVAGGSLICICDMPWQVGPWPVFWEHFRQLTRRIQRVGILLYTCMPWPRHITKVGITSRSYSDIFTPPPPTGEVNTPLLSFPN